jgi:broad specificity phosphatase PhoE
MLSGSVKDFDVPLTKYGQAVQAREVATLLAVRKIDRLYSSDLLRAEQTAKVIAKAVGQKPIYTSLLREIDYGEAEGFDINGLRDREIFDLYGHLFGEDVKGIVARVNEFIELVKSSGLKDGDVVVFVSSAGLMSGFRTALDSGKLAITETDNAEILEWELELSTTD